MSDIHPITPSPELVQQWESAFRRIKSSNQSYVEYMLDQAARWGADQELEACLLEVGGGRRENLAQVIALRDARRPKPPSLKEQALEALDRMDQLPTAEDYHTLCRALEALPE